MPADKCESHETLGMRCVMSNMLEMMKMCFGGDFVVFADGESRNDNHHCLREVTGKSTALQFHCAPDFSIREKKPAELIWLRRNWIPRDTQILWANCRLYTHKNYSPGFSKSLKMYGHRITVKWKRAEAATDGERQVCSFSKLGCFIHNSILKWLLNRLFVRS